MVKKVVSSVLYRIFLPIVLLTAVAFRYNIFSLTYLLLMLLNPLLPAPSLNNFKSGHPRRYLIAVLSISIIFCVSHIVFHSMVLVPGSYVTEFDYCNWKGQLLSTLGLHSVHGIKPLDAIRLIGLDFLVLFSSTGIFISCSKLEPNLETAAEQEAEQNDHYRCVRRKRRRKSELWHWTGELIVLGLLAGAGILRPSLTSAVYFVLFLGICTWFSCNQKLGRFFLLSKVPLSVFAAVHFISLYLYQLKYIQDLIPPQSLAARLLGLTDLIELDCLNARTLIFRPTYWTFYVSPLFILSLYWVLALIIRHRIISPVKEVITKIEETRISRVDSKQSSHVSIASVRRRRQSRKGTRGGGGGDDRTRKTEIKSVEVLDCGNGRYVVCLYNGEKLLDEDHMGRTYQATASSDDHKETLGVDPNGSIIWTSESDMPDKTAANEAETSVSGNMVSKLRKVSSSVVTALKLIAKGSYVVTLIIMMTWSITYHSWLTFVLLLWSCIVWMCPNSREVCLKSSPALVIYAEALLLLQYIFGLQLNDDELPTFNKNVTQIGLVKYGELTYQPLAIKILYTMMFWITLRQFVEERQEFTRRDISEALKRHFSIVPSMTSPNPYVRLIAEVTYSFLVKYWIWVVAIMLMVISLVGDGVVVYRIVYMFLFLFFILMFQFSYRIWRRIMYGFWLTVIIFSMLVLILIYTYQFKDFDKYWEQYLGVPKNVQEDLGLKVYDSDTGTLFLRLLTPTFFLIITIIQLHYFHKEFLIISDIHYQSNEYFGDQCTTLTTAGGPEESTQANIIIDADTEPAATRTATASNQLEIGDVSPIKPSEVTVGVSEPQTPTSPQKEDMDSTRVERELQAVKDCLGNAFQSASKVFAYIAELAWRLLELHIFKIVMFSIMCLAIYDVCAIHFVYMVFMVVAMPMKSLQTFMSHCCAVWTASLLLSKMIYQLNIASYLDWTVNCTDVLHQNGSDLPYPFNETIDSRVWIGYKRTDYLAGYCKGYIGLILVLTIQAVVKIRQKVNRLQLNEPDPRPGVLFPDSTRATADRGVLDCLKFLINYFFYKFGLEVCFITTVACIGTRLDLYAVLSAVWLLSLFLLRRKVIAKIWPFYVAYQCIILPVQYLMCVGLPPGMCISYPWSDLGMKDDFKEWLFLPSYHNDSPNAHKIIADFFQLLFACCQLFVFRIEMSPIAEMYEGGSNKEIYYEDDESAAIRCNPIPDFVTYTKSCLDMLKALLFFSSFWITLAVVFEAGTSRVNLFAMGYVIGCFYFLWNGNEFYLKPRKVLLRMWNVLIAYNVAVILIKTVLQLIGCLYMNEMREKCCAVVQLFGIACLKKYTGDATDHDCVSDDSDAGVIVDGICFGFLLLQKRLFSSYYFQHLVNEIKAQQVLSSRGAELIHEIQMRDVQEQQALEKEIMEKIKKKMDRIRAYQQKIRGGENMEPKTHYQGSEYCSYSTPMYSMATTPQALEPEERIAEAAPTPLPRTLSPGSAFNTQSLDAYMEPKLAMSTRARHARTPSDESYPVFSPPPYPANLETLHHVPEHVQPCGCGPQLVKCFPNLIPARPHRSRSSSAPSSHHASIRSGDYYMFDEYSDEDIDLELGARRQRTEEEEEESAEVKEKGINALLSKAIRSNLKAAGELRRDSGEDEEVGISSRQSTIISADRFPLESTSTEKTSLKSPDAQAIFSSGPATTISLPSPDLTASTSKGETTVMVEDVKLEDAEEEEEPKEETFVEKIKRWWDFFCEFMNSILISCTAKLNEVSRDYRYVARKLSVEKRLLKEQFIRNGSFDMSEAEADMKSRDLDTLPGSSKDLKQVPSSKPSLDFLDNADMKTTPDELDQEFQKSQPVYMKFFVACYYAAISRTELLCYVTIILNQIATASILSLPLPLFVFLWGTLSVPRPTKAFWITIITYTEAIVVLKYLFQFYFFPWNTKSPPLNEPFYPPFLFGIRRDDNYAAYDLIVLMVVFFHRIMLKSLGLWKDTDRNIAFPSNDDDISEKSPENKEDDNLESPPPLPEIKEAASVSVHEDEPESYVCSEMDGEDDGSESVLDELEEAQINLKESFEKIIRPVKQFFYRLLFPKYRVTVDVYAYMFFCDFINFFIVGFGYWAFGTGGSEAVTSYFQDNKVPVPFLIMLIAQFALIVTDRALYLRKYILGKLIFQIILVFVVHMWMFFVLPGITLRQFTEPGNLPPKLWYFTKCVYLLLSAYQIRSGYPTRILGNFFCKKYNYANLGLFKTYTLIPFLYELRSLMDWIWTDTSMSLGNWLKMEDIYANIFVLKCLRRAEEEYPTPRGSKRTAIIKYGVGGSSLLFIILIIWFPLLLFALGNTVGRVNVPISCTVELGISGFEPLFRITALQYQIAPFNEKQWKDLQKSVTKLAEPTATSFLANYDKDDTVIIELSGNSTSIWTISPPSQKALVDQLEGNSEMKMVLSWSFLRAVTSKDISPEVRDQKVLNLTDNESLRRELARMIRNNQTAVELQNIFPNFVEVFGKGNPTVVKQFYPQDNKNRESDFGTNPYRNLNISMHLLDGNDTTSTKWWEAESSGTQDPLDKITGIGNCDCLRMVAFNEKAFPVELSLLSGYGIIGLYTTFVLVVSRVLHGFFAGSSFVIMFDDMPYVDRVLQLCLDIYLVRENREFSLEEDLFAKLIFLYRSPEMLIKWTRPPDQEPNEQRPQLSLQE